MESKIFVGGIKREVDGDTLKNHFRKYGEVKEAIVICFRDSGISRGFGFVTFEEPSAVGVALQDAHVILGRKVEVKEAYSRIRRHNENSNANEVRTKIFVGGLPHSLTDQEFKTFFSRFGVIKDSVVLRDKETNRPRGFGFVTFHSKEAAEMVLQNRFHCMNGNNVEVKMAEPKERKFDAFTNGYHVGSGRWGLHRFDCHRLAEAGYGGWRLLSSNDGHGNAIPLCVHGHAFAFPWHSIYSNSYAFSWANGGYNMHGGYNGWVNQGNGAESDGGGVLKVENPTQEDETSNSLEQSWNSSDSIGEEGDDREGTDDGEEGDDREGTDDGEKGRL